MNKPVLLLDTCALKHLNDLHLGRKPLIKFLFDAFEIRVPPEIFKELGRHITDLTLRKEAMKKRAEWKCKHHLDDNCLKGLLPNLPDTQLWYAHPYFHPDNERHLFAASRNIGERDLFLLFLELSYLGRTPIFLSDDLRATRLAMTDLVDWKIRTGVLWVTLDLVIYIAITGVKRLEGKKVANRFLLKSVHSVIRDLVLRISANKDLQQQLFLHYHALATMTYNLVERSDSFTTLERKYGKEKYR